MPVIRRRPIGFSPGKSFLAIVSLMMTTSGAPGRSRQLKSRPCLIGMPSASKKPGEIVERTAIVRSLTGGSGRPSTAAGERVFPLSAAGRFEAAEAWVTPGSVASFSIAFWKNWPCFAMSGYEPGGRPTKKVVISSARKPGSTFCRRRKLSINKTAPTSSTSESATSATSRPARSRPACRPVVPREESFNESIGSLRDACKRRNKPEDQTGKERKSDRETRARSGRGRFRARAG